jgi:hypothetical protein
VTKTKPAMTRNTRSIVPSLTFILISLNKVRGGTA